MQSSSNNGQGQDDFTFGFAILTLSQQLSALKNKYNYEQPEFASLLNSVTSQFLADEKNKINQGDFKEMIDILCGYLATFPNRIKNKLFYNKQRPDLLPRMDLALAYHYESYRAILEKYRLLYGNNDRQNYMRIGALLFELNFYFENATVNKESSVTLFERRPFKKTFKLDPSKLIAIKDEKLPKPNSSSSSDKKSIPMDGERVTEAEIESLFRDVPEKYQHVKRQPVQALEYDPNIPFDQRKVIGEFSLPPGKFIIDNSPPTGPKQLLLMNFSDKSNSLTFEQINQPAAVLEMDRVDEEIFILKNNLELIIESIKTKKVLNEQEQKFVDSTINNLPALLTRLQKQNALLKNIEVNSVTHSLKEGRKPKIAPYFVNSEDELGEVVKLSEQLFSLLEKQKQKSLPAEAETMQQSMEEEPSLDRPPVKRRKKLRKKLSMTLEEKEEAIGEELSLSDYLTVKEDNAMSIETDDILKEVKEITKAQVAILKKYVTRANKQLLDNLFSNEGTIVNKNRMKELYNLIKGDDNACQRGLHLMVPSEWKNLQAKPSPKQIATPSRRSTRGKKEITIDLTDEETSSMPVGNQPNSWSSPDSPEMSPPPIMLTSVELQTKATDELSPGNLSGLAASETASRKRKLLAETQIELTVEVKKDESKMSNKETHQKNKVSQITRQQYKALCGLLKFSDIKEMSQEIYKKYHYHIKWKSHNVNIIDDETSITHIYTFIQENHSAYSVDPSNWIALSKQQHQASASSSAPKIDVESGRPTKKPKLERPKPLVVKPSSPEEEIFPYNGATEFCPPNLENPATGQGNSSYSNSYSPSVQMPPQQMQGAPNGSVRSFFQYQHEPQNGHPAVMPHQHSPMQSEGGRGHGIQQQPPLQSQLGFFAQMPFGNGNPVGQAQSAVQQQSTEDFVNGLFS